MKRFLFLLLVFIIARTATAQVYWPYLFKYPKCTTMPPAATNCTKWPVVNNGQWDNGATWNGGTIPGNNDIVCIPSGYNVILKSSPYSESAACPAAGTNSSPRLTIFVCGSISFQNPGKLYLACFSFIQIWPGGTVYADNGSSDLIQIADKLLWGGNATNNQGNLTGPSYVAAPAVGNGVLPAMFDYIKINLSNPYQVTLEWGTIQEFNTSSFIVERSNDQKIWTAIGNVKSVGNSSLKTTYSFVDKNPLGGASYYRIKQIDVDGTNIYSDIVKSENSLSSKKISIYPTPVSGIVNLYSKTNFKPGQQLQLIDAKGTKVKAFSTTGSSNTMQIDLTTFKPGLYLLQVIDNGSVAESLPLIKQ